MVSEKNDVIEIDPNDLSPHTLNITIYGDEEADPELMASIEENGQLEKIVIKEDKTIISGHRRWLALKALGQPAVCRVVEYDSDTEEHEALIEFNRQREKVPSQIYNEAKTLKELYTKKGKDNPFDTEKVDVPNSARSEKTRDRISEATGVKRDKLSKIIEICETAEMGDHFVIELKRRMDSGEKTVHAAHCALRIYIASKSGGKKGKFARGLHMKIEGGALSENVAIMRLNDFKEKHKKQKTEDKAPQEDEDTVDYEDATPDETDGDEPDNIPEEETVNEEPQNNEEHKYDVLLVNPNYISKNKHIFDLGAMHKNDSVLFIFAENDLLSLSTKIIDVLGFECQTSFVVYPRPKPVESKWFNVVNSLLLICTRGNPADPVKTECESVIYFDPLGNNKISDIIEEMYPNRKYALISKKPEGFDRPGWNEYDSYYYNEINISERVYKSIEKNKYLIKNILEMNKYNMDYDIEPEESTTYKTTIVTPDQFSQLNKLAKEHGAHDLNEVIIRLHEGFRESHPFQQYSVKKGG